MVATISTERKRALDRLLEYKGSYKGFLIFKVTRIDFVVTRDGITWHKQADGRNPRSLKAARALIDVLAE